MNPCPCGNYGSANQTCTCTPSEIRNYRKKISGPLLDRIDLQVEVDNVSYDELTSKECAESSSDVKRRVDEARNIQRERFGDYGIATNAEMGEREIGIFCGLSKEGDEILREAFHKMHLTTRARARIVKVARTIADLDFSESILAKHVYEAASYRLNDKIN